MTKILKLHCLMVLGLLLFASPLHAGLADLQVRELDAFHNSAYFVPLDSHLMNIDYVGSSTEACLGASSSTLTSATPFGTADTAFGTAGTYDISTPTYNTIGEVCTAINALTYYSCILTGGKADDNSNLLANMTAVSGSYDAKANGGFNVKIDTGTTEYMGPTHTPYMSRIGITPQSGRRVILLGCVNTSDGTDDTLVYGKLRMYEGVSDGVTRNDTTKVYHSVASANDTARIIPNALWPFSEWMEFGKDEHVIIQEADGTTAQTATSFINCFWIER